MARTTELICILLWIGSFVSADRSSIIFREDDDDRDSFAARFNLDTDDMEYEQDNGNDTLIPKLVLTRDEEQNYIALPDKDGTFGAMSRMAVVESRVDSSKFEAAEFVKFHFYARSNNYQPVELRYDQIRFLPDHHGFNEKLPTKILIHGWLGGSDSEVIEPLAKDFLDQGNFNVIAVDWEKGARTLLYPVARYRVAKVAELVAAVINQLLGFGQTSDQIGIIGHSLGAHIAGLAGKKANKKVGFIVGLDPAAPLFRLKKPAERLSNSDAHYVEVIHTNGKGLGIFGNIGNTDFYPNGGSSQPGCGWNLSCSHQRAVDYFKESLKSKNYFANRCSDVNELNSNCSLGRATMGGLEALRTRGKPGGVYYASTAPDKPFLRSLNDFFKLTDESRITFFDNDDEELSFANGTQSSDLDDMEYERDNEGDTLIPQLRMSHELQENYITLPDKEGDFQIMPRMAVRESRHNSSQYDAAKYVQFRFYSSSNQSTELGFDQIQTLVFDHGFNVLLPTVILVHGWLGSSESEVIEPLARELLEHTNLNVLAVDWEKGASTLLYPVARYRVPKVGKLVAAVIDRFLDYGQTPEQIGIVGHSLGAHIAGIAGKNTRRKIACIVALDPASPLFRLKKPAKRLADTDAQYVEVIHTNGKALGIFARIGVADFYPNGGAKQPGCGWNISCSHQRAVDYFKESLKMRNYFAQRCTDEKGLDSNCSLGVASLGGFRALGSRGKPRGVYYTRTAEEKPFLRDE